MAEQRYYMQSQDTGNVYGPMTAGDRGNYKARGYKDVTDQHSGGDEQRRNAGTPASPQRPERQSARPAPSQQPAPEQPS